MMKAKLMWKFCPSCDVTLPLSMSVDFHLTEISLPLLEMVSV